MVNSLAVCRHQLQHVTGGSANAGMRRKIDLLPNLPLIRELTKQSKRLLATKAAFSAGQDLAAVVFSEPIGKCNDVETLEKIVL